MIRSFSAEDIADFPNIKILSYPATQPKKYLLIERKPFVSCLVIIDQKYTLLIKQFRPVIQQETLEIPMGKIESYDPSILSATIRELQEECNLFIQENSYLVVKNNKTSVEKHILFSSYQFKADIPNYTSPGFSNSKQYPFTLTLETQSGNFLEDLEGFHLCSQEQNLFVTLAEISPKLVSELEGITKYMVMDYLFHKQ
ncbi:MAG: NUDIX hydrolase [Brevinema sp.]